MIFLLLDDYGFIAHFNGFNWQIYNNYTIKGIFIELSIKNNIVAIAGNYQG